MTAATRPLPRLALPAVSPALALLWFGFATLAIPTLYDVALGPWALEGGSYGMIVLAIGLWLVARRTGAMRRAGVPGNAWAGGIALAVTLAAHVFARLLLNPSYEAASLYAVTVVALYLRFGAPGLRAAAFPVVYLALAIPPPPAWIALITRALRLWITDGAVDVLGNAGLMIAKEGLTIFIDQYQIAVVDACSGINSMISLTAIGLFYVYARGRRLGALTLPPILALILLCAAAGNFVRVVAIVLLTHFFGEAVAQGPLHETAGFLTFAVSLGGVMLLDAVLFRFLPASDIHD